MWSCLAGACPPALGPFLPKCHGWKIHMPALILPPEFLTCLSDGSEVPPPAGPKVSPEQPLPACSARKWVLCLLGCSGQKSGHRLCLLPVSPSQTHHSSSACPSSCASLKGLIRPPSPHFHSPQRARTVFTTHKQTLCICYLLMCNNLSPKSSLSRQQASLISQLLRAGNPGKVCGWSGSGLLGCRHLRAC